MIPIIINPRGRLGNMMFQYMLALKIQDRLRGAGEIFGIEIREWNIRHAAAPQVSFPLVLNGHTFDLDEVSYFLRCGVFDSVVINGWGMRVEYYGGPSEYFHIFPPEEEISFGNDVILINVRLEDIATGRHPGYYCMPFDFYDKVIASSGKHPIFMGQLGNDVYTSNLKNAFPCADFLPEANAMVDFRRLQTAKHVCLSISSFTWLATWLSTVVEKIHIPVAGIFDPRRGLQNLIPIPDDRYQFWDVKIPKMRERGEIDPIEWSSSYKGVSEINEDIIKKIVLGGATRRINHRTVQALTQKAMA